MTTNRFHVGERPGPWPLLELHDAEARSHVVVAPTRGGMVTAFAVAGRELLFLNEETFRDPNQNVRGGNPVLFPSPGKLPNDTWSWQGHAGRLKQHGFARLLPWVEQSRRTDEGAEVVLRLGANDETLPQYPFRFTVDLTYRLVGASLHVGQRVRNDGAEPMPFGIGFHPYFAVPQPDKGRVRIPTAATRVFDNVSKTTVPFAPPDLTANEVDWHLVDHGSSSAALVLADSARIELLGSADYTHWVIWTRRGNDFVCLEPWTCPGGALATGERLQVLAPGEERTFSIELRFVPPPA